MSYTEEEIKTYLEILHNYGPQRSWDNYKNKTEESKNLNAKIVKVIVFLFIQVIKLVNLAVV